MPHPLRSWHSRPGWSEFGAPRPNGSWKTHRGFDYYAPEGTPIYGTAEGGKVVAVRNNPDRDGGFGHSIRIAYPGGVETLDAHMLARSPLNVGDPVGVRTIVGYVGATGNAHDIIWRGMRNDHHEVTVGGSRVDPIAYHGASLAGESIADSTDSKEIQMPILVPLVVGNPPRTNGDYAIIGDGGIVGLRAKEDANLINIAKRAMIDGEPIYGNQGDQLQALFARVAVKPTIDYKRLAAELAPLLTESAAESFAEAALQRLKARL